MSVGRYHVDVWYSLTVTAQSRDDAEQQAMAEVRATVDQPASIDVAQLTPREPVKSGAPIQSRRT